MDQTTSALTAALLESVGKPSNDTTAGSDQALANQWTAAIIIIGMAVAATAVLAIMICRDRHRAAIAGLPVALRAPLALNQRSNADVVAVGYCR